MSVRVQNWKGEIAYQARSVEKIGAVEDLQRIVRDPDRYPSPVRAMGSHHSTTRCVVAEGGTVCDLSGLDRIVRIDKENLTITMQAGVLLIDAAKALEAEGLQFFVNVELGNLTMGSGATGGTKDASYFDDGAWEFGQVASYCVGVKTVQPDGSVLEVTTDGDPELMAAMRSSFGLIGIVYETTFRVKPISAMAVEHEVYDVRDFVARLDALLGQERAMMLFLFPFLDKVMVEYRYDTDLPLRPGALSWRIRNLTWKTLWPFLANLLAFLPCRRVRYGLTNLANRFTAWFTRKVIRARDTSPADQIIRYSDKAGFASYTFSIWAFPRERYGDILLKYFAFCRDHYARTGYRTDMMNVGYHIAQDRSSLFSYTRDWAALTIDPVASGRGAWPDFLDAYNAFCSEAGGRPLFNQSGQVTPGQAARAFGPEIREFRAVRDRMDPDGRFRNDFFRDLFAEA